MDPIVLVVIIAVGTPLAVVAALAYSARLRGRAPGKESRRRVDALVTEAIPEEPPEEQSTEDDGPGFSIDSPPPEPDPGLRGRSEA